MSSLEILKLFTGVAACVGHVHFFHIQHPLIDEEYPCSGEGGIGGISQFTHSGVVNKASDEQHEAQGQEHPPQPVLPIKVTREVGRKPDNKNPFDEGQAEARDGSVSAGCWCRQTERQEEADPVEEECHEESEHEDAIISYSQLISIFKVIPGHKVVLLHRYISITFGLFWCFVWKLVC